MVSKVNMEQGNDLYMNEKLFVSYYLEPALVAIRLLEIERRSTFLHWFPTRRRLQRNQRVRRSVRACLAAARAFHGGEAEGCSAEQLLRPHAASVRGDLSEHLDALVTFAAAHVVR